MTPRQYQLFQFILSYKEEKGVAPTLSEMMEDLSIKSKSGVFMLLKGLEQRGYIKRRHGLSRAIKVIRMPDGHAAL